MLRQRDPNIAYTRDEFARINELQNGMGVCAIRTRKGISILKNNYKKLSTYYKLLDAQAVDIETAYAESVESRIRKICAVTELSLEKCILLVLANEYLQSENAYYTTTQISKMIKKLFTSLRKKKNKNNISRYFNMTFYPYYEISQREGRIVYKLSPLGYSEALLMLRNIERRIKRELK